MAIRFTKNHPTYKCFSNFYPITITFDGITYASSEAAWQAQKCANYEDRKEFTNLSPSDAKKLGRHVTLRPDWEDIKYQLMIDICLQKFQSNRLKEILLSTGNEEIIEDTTGWHDNIWGDCQCPKCMNRPGHNLLGKALMAVRDNLRQI